MTYGHGIGAVIAVALAIAVIILGYRMVRGLPPFTSDDDVGSGIGGGSSVGGDRQQRK